MIEKHSKTDWTELVQEFESRCVRCGCNNEPLTKDHIEPIYLGGHDGISNLQPLCRSCNSGRFAPKTRPNEIDNWVEYRRINGFET